MCGMGTARYFESQSESSKWKACSTSTQSNGTAPPSWSRQLNARRLPAKPLTTSPCCFRVNRLFISIGQTSEGISSQRWARRLTLGCNRRCLARRGSSTMTPMAILVVSLLAIMILLPLGAAWFANRAGIFETSVVKVSRIINFPLSRTMQTSRHRHTDAA